MNYLQLCLSNLSFLKEYFMCPRIKSVTPGSFKRQGIRPWMFVRIFKTAGPFCRRISGNPANPYRGQGELALLPPWPSWSAISFSCCWASNAPGFECQVLEEALGSRRTTAQLRREAMLGRGGAEGQAHLQRSFILNLVKLQFWVSSGKKNINRPYNTSNAFHPHARLRF